MANFNGPLKDAARRGLVLVVADTDPKRAFVLLEGLSQWSDPRLAESVFTDWAASNPAEAATNAAKLPAGYFRDNALSLVSREWASRDSEGAAAWAASLPSDEPSSSNRSRNTIPFQADPRMTVMSTWMDRDPDAARRWIAKVLLGFKTAGEIPGRGRVWNALGSQSV